MQRKRKPGPGMREALSEMPWEFADHEAGNVAATIPINSLKAIEGDLQVSKGEWLDMATKPVSEWQKELRKTVKTNGSELPDSPPLPSNQRIEEKIVHIENLYSAASSLYDQFEGEDTSVGVVFDEYMRDNVSEYGLEDGLEAPEYLLLPVSHVISNSEIHASNASVQEGNEIPDLITEDSSSFIICDDGCGIDIDEMYDIASLDRETPGGRGVPLIEYIDIETDVEIRYLPSEDQISNREYGSHSLVYSSAPDVSSEGCCWYFEFPDQ